MDGVTRPCVFASPPATKYRINKKRKCSFGSAEKKDRKQNRDGIFKENSHENWDQNIKLDNEYSPSLSGSWADQVEEQENFHQRTKLTKSKKQLELNPVEEKPANRKKSNSFKRQLQPILTDPHRINQRQKQLDMGRNTLGYEMYTKNVLRAQRSQDDPWTPDKYQQCSTRSWQGQVKSWRRRLHLWDPENTQQQNDPFSTSISFNSEGDTTEQDSEIFQDSFSASCSQSSEEAKVLVEGNLFDDEVFASFSMNNPNTLDILPV